MEQPAIFTDDRLVGVGHLCSFIGYGRLLKFPVLIFWVPELFFLFFVLRLYLLCWDFIYSSSWPGFEVTTDSGSSNHRTQSHTDRLRPYWPLLLAPTGEPTTCWG